MLNDANFELSTQTTLDLNLVVYHQMITHADGTQLAIETKVSLVSVLTAAPPAPCACIRIISYDTTSIRKVMRMSLVIRDVTSSVHVKREPEPATTCKAHLRVLSDGWKRKHRLVLIDGDGSERVIASLGGHHHPFPGIFQPHISRCSRVRRVVATLASQRLRPTPCWRRRSPPSPRGEPTSAAIVKGGARLLASVPVGEL